MMALLLLLACAVLAQASVNFLAVGDWGGINVPPYTTPGQTASAKGMQKVAKNINSDFVLALGDNFYFTGIGTDENDSRFQTTFERVYSGASLQTPWYVVAGNHDYKGNVTAQIAYSSHSKRWTFPSLYHSRSVTSADGVTVEVVLIDTVSLTDAPLLSEDHPDYYRAIPEVSRSVGGSQWDWIEAQLAASKAQYLLVGGHFPVYSVCDHGPTATLITHLRPLLEKYNAHYLSGHDHCLNHFQEPGSKVNYVLSGMGDTCCYRSTNMNNPSIPKDSLKWYMDLSNSRNTSAGFNSFVATHSSLQITYHDQDGNTLFAADPIAPRV